MQKTKCSLAIILSVFTLILLSCKASKPQSSSDDIFVPDANSNNRVYPPSDQERYVVVGTDDESLSLTRGNGAFSVVLKNLSDQPARPVRVRDVDLRAGRRFFAAIEDQKGVVIGRSEVPTRGGSIDGISLENLPPRVQNMAEYFDPKFVKISKFGSSFGQSRGQAKVISLSPEELQQPGMLYRLLGDSDEFKILVDRNQIPRESLVKMKTKGVDVEVEELGEEFVDKLLVTVKRNNIAYRSSFLELATGGKASKLDDLNPRDLDHVELKRWTAYAPDGKKVDLGVAQTDETREAFIKQLDPEKTLVIGNGGAGMAGMLEHWAKRYNAENPDRPLTIVWRGGHSKMNIDQINNRYLDVGLTYDPMFEVPLLKQGLIHPPNHIFYDQMSILLPPGKDPLGVRQANVGDSPQATMDYMMRKSLLEDGVEPDDIVYFSRYNASAMGEKDQMMFRIGVKKLAKDPEVQAKYGRSNLSEQEILDFEVDLYERWMRHVHTEERLFPPHIFRYAQEGSGASMWQNRRKIHRAREIEKLEEKLTNEGLTPGTRQYQERLNAGRDALDKRLLKVDEAIDRGFAQLNDQGTMAAWGVKDKSEWVLHKDPDAYLRNPAQIIAASHLSKSAGTPLGDFLGWGFGRGGVSSIRDFRPPDNRAASRPSPFSPYTPEEFPSAKIGDEIEGVEDPFAGVIEYYARPLMQESPNPVLRELRENNPNP